MSKDRIKSELFVGRDKELRQFQNFLKPRSKSNILNIHSKGDGGIGKTRLLLRMQELCASFSENVLSAKELIDFYHTESRSKLGVMQQIAYNLGLDNFPQFSKKTKEYHETPDASVRQELLSKLEEVFKNDYTAFSGGLKGEKVIVLFFDTYEVIQSPKTTVGEQKYEESIGFSQWIEKQLFPYISLNTRLIISGRYPLQDIDHPKLSVEEINLSHFGLSETKAFWKSCFNVTTNDKLAKKIGSETLIKNLHALADGRPILLALFADWMNYERNPLRPKELLDDIEREAGKITKSITKKQEELFEKALIKRIESLVEPEDRAVVYMAIAHHRMTPHMFHSLTDIPLDECRSILLKKLKPLSFIKYKGGQVVQYEEGEVILLHDEARRLIVQHWWNEQDPDRSIRKGIAEKLVSYYDEELLNNKDISDREREIYTSELLEYAFLADPQKGLERFCNEFDIGLEDGRYDYCNLILREAENYHHENPQDILFPDYLKINLRRVRYTTEVEGNYKESLQMVNAVLENYADRPEWEHSDLRGHFLMERGIAEFSLEQFEKSVDSFQKAHDVFFYEVGEDIWLHWAHNWIGYAYYRQGQFAEAETYLIQSRDGFYRVLSETSDLPERKRRQLLQGILIVLGNLTAVYNYIGQSDKAIQNAEIALDIVRRLPRNTVDIARIRATTGRAFVYAGRAIDARHHFVEADKLLQEVRSRAITGRIKKDLGILQYRIAELSHILEYYRAEDLEKIIEKRYVSDKDIEMARRLINEAIKALGEEPAIKKELADAYYALGELYMVTPSEGHWHQSEQAFLESLKWGKESKFHYIVVDTLESLVTLYYFWNGASEVPPEVKAENRKKMEGYQKELEEAKEFDETRYPNLFGKYHITFGDIKFDEALEVFHSEQPENLEAAMTSLKEAFRHYVTAASLMETFNDELYYLTLQVLYKRLNVFIDEQLQKSDISTVVDQLNELKPLWEKPSEIKRALRTHFRCQRLYEYVLLRIQQENLEEGIQNLQKDLQEVLDKRGNFGWVLLLADCLIQVYKSLLSKSPENEVYREKLILQLKETSGYYRVLGDDYRAQQYILAARDELEHLSSRILGEGLEGCLDVSEGTLKYRTGEYNQELLFYLQDQLEIARGKFDGQFPGIRREAFELLQTSEKTLHTAISTLEQRLPKVAAAEEKVRLHERIRIYQRHLAETRFRLGELLILHEDFTNREYENSLEYLQEAIKGSEEIGDHYRHDSAMTSYVNALYFSGNYDHPDHRDQREKYEEHLEEKLTVPGAPVHPPVMGKLRIVQGDALFSRSFERKFDEVKGYKYVARESEIDVPTLTRTLRTMLRYYVEACNFMAQHSSIYFAAAVRVLQRRIELLSDRFSLGEILHSLPLIWTGQKHLKEKTEELQSLSQFAKIRSAMLTYEDIR